MPFWAYILRCADGLYYTGHTDDLERRLGEHQTGALPSCWTYKRRPVELVWSEVFQTRYEALEAERRVGGWSKAKKEALIRGDWKTISWYARAPKERPGTNSESRFSTTLETNGGECAHTPPTPFASSKVEKRSSKSVTPPPFASSEVEKRSSKPVTPSPFASSEVEKPFPEART